MALRARACVRPGIKVKGTGGCSESRPGVESERTGARAGRHCGARSTAEKCQALDCREGAARALRGEGPAVNSRGGERVRGGEGGGG